MLHGVKKLTIWNIKESMSWHYTIPPVYTEKNFFYSVGVKRKDFQRLVSNKSSNYKIGRQTKKSGGYRIIYKPNKELKNILQAIYKKYLSRINLPPFVHCGVKNRSIVTALRGHNKYKYHLSLDIKSFFDEITIDTLKKSLKITKVPTVIINNIVSLCIEDNHLPQGFPTSSYLSSLVICTTLEKLGAKLKLNNIKFSAYADDLLISADYKKQLLETEISIKKELASIGLSLNDKRKIWSMKDNEIALGLNIHPFPSVRRSEVKKLQKALYDSRKTKLGAKELRSLRGKLSFYSSSNKNKLTEKIKKEIRLQLE